MIKEAQLMNLIERILMMKVARHMSPLEFTKNRDKFIEEYYEIINQKGGIINNGI